MLMRPLVLLTLLALPCTLTARGLTPETRREIEADWARQEQVAWKRTCGDPKALEEVLIRGRLLISDLRGDGVGTAEAERILHEIERAGRSGGDRRNLYHRARWAIRDLAFRSPEVDFDQIIFVRRHWPRINHQCSHRVGEAQEPGANLCVLRGLSPDGAVRDILPSGYAHGGIGRFDLSFDGKRIVFPYAAPRPDATPYGYGLPGVRAGACVMYDIYEVGLDGSDLQQLTDNPDAEDTEPIYLPGGRIAFMTSRDDRYVQCGDWALACGLYTMAADGTDLRRVTEPKEGEFYPNMLDDGRILYPRWDYVMKGYNVIQQLWAVNPDGRAASLLFGDHYAYSVGPIAFFEARQVPGTRKVICTGAAHHNTGVGPILVLDLDQNRGTRSAMVNLTPEVGYPEINSRVFREVSLDELPGKGISNVRNDTGWYSSPYPLSDRQFLAVASFEADNTVSDGYALYLMDVHGNKELVYRAEGMSCYSPMPVRPREAPPVIPDLVTGVDTATPATLVVSDVYQGLPGVARGEVKYLRILETHSKTVRTKPQRCDVGVNSGWDIRGVLGTVPVEPDGSAHFLAQPHRQLFLEALDEDFLEIRRMRNFMNVMPGETVGCIGCHEPPRVTPVATPAAPPMALRRPPSVITPPPWGTSGLGFEKVVQPVLNRHCVGCHDGSKGEEKSFDLSGGRLASAPAGYDPDHAPHAQHLVSEAFLKLLEFVSYIRVGGYQGEKLPLPPNATGSRRSRLMAALKKGHYDVKLDEAEWRALAAWIDCNAPYYGGWDEILLPEASPGPLRSTEALSSRDRARVEARMKDIELDGGARVLTYLDCGLQRKSGDSGAVIQLVKGRGWAYAGSDVVPNVPAAQRDIAFDAEQLVFDVTGLKLGTAHKLHLGWWDFNTDQRRQSIWLSKPDGSGRRVLREAAGLPSYQVRKEFPETVTLNLPADLIAAGTIRIIIQCDGGANAVVGELWLTEGR